MDTMIKHSGIALPGFIIEEDYVMHRKQLLICVYIKKKPVPLIIFPFDQDLKSK